MPKLASVIPFEAEEAERKARETAIAEARRDPRVGVPHETIRAEMLREIDRLRRKIASDL